MKKYIIALIITILFLSSPAYALYRVTDFIGGCADCADAIDGARFNAKTKPVYVIVTTTPEHATYPSKEFAYLWDSDAGCSEVVPDSIIPDTNASGGCLMLLTPGQAADIVADSVKDTHIDWGTGAEQVSAVDVPIADSGSIITGTEVETALQENRGLVNTITANVAAHTDTTATGVELNELTDNSVTSKHRHSGLSASDGTPDNNFALDANGDIGFVGDFVVTGNATINGADERVTFDSGGYLDGNDAGTNTVTIKPKAVTTALSFGLTDLNTRLMTLLTTYNHPANDADFTLIHSYINYLTPTSLETDTVGSQPWVYKNITAGEITAKEDIWTINGSGGDEYMCTGTVADTCADDADYSWNDAANEGFAFIGWFDFPASGSIQSLLSKWAAAGTREYRLNIVMDTGLLSLNLHDDSAAVTCSQLSTSAAVTVGWHQIVARYTAVSGGGADANDDITLFIDGVDVTTTNTTCVGYVGMEDLAEPVLMGATVSGSPAQLFQGDMGPYYFIDLPSGTSLTDAKILETYNMQAEYMGE